MEKFKSLLEDEIEAQVLPQTKKLSDGSFGKIISRNQRDKTGAFTYNCHLCRIAKLPGENAVKVHIIGKKHERRLRPDYIPDVQQFREKIQSKQCKFLEIPYFQTENLSQSF
jgi:hypothetical protein